MLRNRYILPKLVLILLHLNALLLYVAQKRKQFLKQESGKKRDKNNQIPVNLVNPVKKTNHPKTTKKTGKCCLKQ
jgi:hypothetical protein